MKITHQQLEQQLSNVLAPIYIVASDETLLIQEALDVIRQEALKQGFAERIKISIDANWIQQLRAETQSLSLFSHKRLIDVDLSQIKINAATSKAFQEIIQQLSPDILLLIRCSKLDSKTEKNALFKDLEKKGVLVTLWPITIEQLPLWILQRAKKNQLNLTKAAAELLATLVEGNLLAAAQEIEKLRLMQLGETVDIDTITNIVTDNSHFDIFVLVDNVVNGNQKRSLHILETLSAEDVEPTLILWALTREFRTLVEIIKYTQQGTPLNRSFEKFRIWQKRQSSVRAFLKRHSQETSSRLLIKAAEVDRLIKGAEKGNVWIALQQLILMA